MPSKPITQNPEYLEFLKFIFGRKQFSSSEFILEFIKTEKIQKHKYNKIQNLSKKLQYLRKTGLIISLSKKPKPNKIKGSNGGRSGIYQDNTFNYFLSEYFLPNFNNDLKRKHKQILFYLFSRELSNLLTFSKSENKKIHKAYRKNLEFNTIEELFSKISNHLLDYLTYQGLENYNYKLI